MGLPDFLSYFLKPESVLGLFGVGAEIDAQNRLNQVAQNALGFDTDTGTFDFRGSEMGDIARQGELTGARAQQDLRKILGTGRAGGRRMLQQFNANAGRTNQLLGSLQNEADIRGAANLAAFNQGGAAMQEGYAQRETDVMGLLEGLGTSARTDIGQQFAQSGAEAQANLARRGLGTSTLTSGAARANQAREAQEITRLNESVSNVKAGTLSGLRGEALAARERQLTNASNIGMMNTSNFLNTGGAMANALQTQGLNRANIQGQNLTRDQQNMLNMTNQRLSTAGNTQQLRLGAMQSALASLAPADVAGALGNLGQTISAIRQAEAYESAQPSGAEAFFGGGGASALGSGLGMGLGALLAVPTGGLSIAGGAALGGAVGSASGGLAGLPFNM